MYKVKTAAEYDKCQASDYDLLMMNYVSVYIMAFTLYLNLFINFIYLL